METEVMMRVMREIMEWSRRNLKESNDSEPRERRFRMEVVKPEVSVKKKNQGASLAKVSDGSGEYQTQDLVSSIPEGASLLLFELFVSMPCMGKGESSGMSEGRGWGL